eukprot:m.31018 g.31018  ORF g.31018 m.31018 type:complete len:516 (+) comp16384_c0_seq1:67-1614(+)
MDQVSMSTIAVCTLVGVLLCHYILKLTTKKSGITSKHNLHRLPSPPSAPNPLPFLGHALSYKKDPPGYLESQTKALGGVFKLNLAGLHITIVSDAAACKAFATAPSQVLSLKHAVADFGFQDTLGPLNVHLGSDVHRSIIKMNLYPLLEKQFVDVVTIVNDAVDQYLPGSTGKFDMIPTMRKIALKYSIEHFIGETVLELYPDFIDTFITFQDQLEEAIAKATALPEILAKVLLLWPTKRQRQKVENKLSHAIATMWKNDKGGVWTRGMKTMKMDKLSGWLSRGPLLQDTQVAMTADDAASLCCGLLFASHKNPSIGIAQTLLFLIDPTNSDISKRASPEIHKAGKLLQCPETETDTVTASSFEQATSCFGNCISEALRLSSHSIGAIRKVMKDDGFVIPTLNTSGYYVEKGSYIGVSHILPHMNEDVFENWQTFDPSRFEREFTDYEFTTFSHGIHRCPGKRLASLLMKTIGVRILSKYDLKPVGAIPPLSFERATLAQRSGECLIEYQLKTDK